MSEPTSAPPVGVIPRWRYNELQDSTRIAELSEAIRRYIEAGKQPHEEWAEEIVALANKPRKRINV